MRPWTSSSPSIAGCKTRAAASNRCWPAAAKQPGGSSSSTTPARSRSWPNGCAPRPPASRASPCWKTNRTWALWAPSIAAWPCLMRMTCSCSTATPKWLATGSTASAPPPMATSAWPPSRPFPTTPPFAATRSFAKTTSCPPATTPRGWTPSLPAPTPAKWQTCPPAWAFACTSAAPPCRPWACLTKSTSAKAMAKKTTSASAPPRRAGATCTRSTPSCATLAA